jgi:hypothetical protein
MKYIYKLFDYVNSNLSPSFFGNGNLFSYNIFNMFMKKNIFNKMYRNNNQAIYGFEKNGYVKLNSIPEEQINELNALLIKYNTPKVDENYCYNFTINAQILDKVKNIIDQNFSIFLKNFSNFYNMKIKLGYIQIKRNYPIPQNYTKEAYSNFFHCDAYTLNLFKIFINLQDIDETNGPFTLVKKEKAKFFIKKSNYKNRFLYDETKVADCYFVNTGKKGDTLLCSTTEIIHKAGDVEKGKYRDILFLDFVAYPFDENHCLNDNNEALINGDIVRKIAKPKGIKELIKLYRFCNKNKFRNN